MILSPQFWEWFNIWITQVLKLLYYDPKMVALRGNNCANSVSHGCVGGAENGAGAGVGAGAAGLPGGLALQPPHHLAPLQLQPLNSVSLHLFNNSSHHSHSHALKHEPSSTRYTNPTTYTPSHHYRLLAQTSKSLLPGPFTLTGFPEN